MEKQIFNEVYVHDKKILNITNLIIDHNFSYKKNEQGINILGTISLTFIIKDENKESPISISKDIDMFIPLSKIDSLKEIELEVESSSYEINENNVKFEIVAKLLGDKEDFIFFKASPNEKINDKTISLLMRNEEVDNFISIDNKDEIEKLIKSNIVELISTSSNEIKDDDIIEISTFENENKNPIPIINEKINEDINRNVISNEKDNVNDDYKENTLQKSELKPQIKELKEEKETIFKEKYVSKFLFYVVKDNENKEDIIKKFNMNENDFDILNPSVIIKKGKLIRVKK